jgi:hypothetical protein
LSGFIPHRGNFICQFSSNDKNKKKNHSAIKKGRPPTKQPKGLFDGHPQLTVRLSLSLVEDGLGGLWGIGWILSSPQKALIILSANPLCNGYVLYFKH